MLPPLPWRHSVSGVLGRAVGAGPAGPLESCSGPGPWRRGAPSDRGTVEAPGRAWASSREASPLRAVGGHVGFPWVLTVMLMSLTPWTAVCHSVVRHSGLSGHLLERLGALSGRPWLGPGGDWQLRQVTRPRRSRRGRVLCWTSRDHCVCPVLTGRGPRSADMGAVKEAQAQPRRCWPGAGPAGGEQRGSRPRPVWGLGLVGRGLEAPPHAPPGLPRRRQGPAARRSPPLPPPQPALHRPHLLPPPCQSSASQLRPHGNHGGPPAAFGL